jgi:transcription antitermination factor NusG
VNPVGTFELTTIARADSPSLIAVREPELPTAYVEPSWYAAYTRTNHEKRVAEQLEVRAVEYFLPFYKSIRRWKDRRVQLELPLFPGYVFVRLPLRDRLQVLEVPSVVRLVGFNGHPLALPEREIEALRESLAQQLKAIPHPYLTVGRRVRIKSGPLSGLEGVLVRKKGSFQVILSIDLIMRSVIAQVELSDLELIH